MTLPSPEIAEILALRGFDWLFLDMEHGLLDFTAVQRVLQAAAGCPCLVRLASHDAIDVMKALDVGAAGVIVPHVNTADEARAAVQAARYPPVGTRSVGVARAHRYGPGLSHAIAHANDEVLVVAQIEHIAAVRAIRDIVAVPGIDAVFVGPFDLSASMGKPGDVGAPDVRAAIADVEASAAARALPCGIFAPTADAARQAFAAGHSLVAVSTDTVTFGEAAADLAARIRA